MNLLETVRGRQLIVCRATRISLSLGGFAVVHLDVGLHGNAANPLVLPRGQPGEFVLARRHALETEYSFFVSEGR